MKSIFDKNYEDDLDTLERICLLDIKDRHDALMEEVKGFPVSPVVLDDGTIVLPSESEHPIALTAHYDKEQGSYGYNDNGMSLVAILGMLDELPKNVEVVFTNGEENGFGGAKRYVHYRKKRSPVHCINLDVCGVGDTIYMDRLNSTLLYGITDVVEGGMPPNDGAYFAYRGIESVCLSASYGTDFDKGIRIINSTIHNADFDNRIDILDFDMLPRIREMVLRMTGIIEKGTCVAVEKGLHAWQSI